MGLIDLSNFDNIDVWIVKLKVCCKFIIFKIDIGVDILVIIEVIYNFLLVKLKF